jgi:hypothetical protein
MADRKNEKPSSLKRFFSRRKKEEQPDPQVTQGEEEDFKDTGLDLWESETKKMDLGSLSMTKDKQAPVKEEVVQSNSPDIQDSSLAVPHDLSDFENEEAEVVSQRFAAPRFEPVKKTIWSEEQPVRGDGVVTIDEIDDLSGLILPKSATFEVDELKVHAMAKVFALKSSGRIPDYNDTALTGEEFRTISEAVTEIEAEAPKKNILAKLNPLSAIHKEVSEYDRKIHGPLVDLTFRPRPGIEEIEIYPVNEPYGYIRITYNHATHENTYEILEPVLTKAGK